MGYRKGENSYADRLRRSMPTFAIDLDSVLFDCDTPIRKAVQTFLGLPELPPRPMHWELESSYGLDQSALPTIWESVWNQKFDLYEGAEHFLDRLRKKFRVVAVSTRALGPARNHGLQMLEPIKHLFDAVHWTTNATDKADAVRMYKGVWFFDDSLANHFAVKRVCPDTKLILRDHPWNQSHDYDPIWTRIKTFAEVLKLVNCNG